MKGWYLVAFASELTSVLTPAAIGKHRLVLVQDGDRVRAFDATCPHRGAHLAHGGRLCKQAIICPFHGHAIGLGPSDLPFWVAEHVTWVVGGLVFVRLADGHDNGWSRIMAALARDASIVQGFRMSIRAPMQTIIENAFDRRHFRAVHGVQTGAFHVTAPDDGGLVVESAFHVPDPRGAAPGALMPAPYRAQVVSPGLAAVELRGPAPYVVITGATDEPEGGCVVRLSVAFPRAVWPHGPPPAVYEPLLRYSRSGLEEDRAIWESLSPDHAPRWTAEDQPSLRFLEFCEAHLAG